jgi:hypothetical protein
MCSTSLENQKGEPPKARLPKSGKPEGEPAKARLPKSGKPEGEPAKARLPKHGKAVGEPAGVRLPKQGKQRVSRPKRRYPTTGKLMRLCHSMASDSPSEQFYIGRMDTIKNRQCEENFWSNSSCR